jgi:site-specific DNA-methyltransferase (adenine-specific)
MNVMERNKIYQGDCLDVLRQFPDNSVTAVVTDPPYGLSKQPDMREVLKHWLAGDDYEHCGTGFMGKCYHPSTDILTESGWRHVGEIQKGEMVCSLNPETREIEYVECVDTFEYDFDGYLSHIHGRSVEQMVTPNHNTVIDHVKSRRLELRRADKLPASFRMVNQGSWSGCRSDKIFIDGSYYPSKSLFLFLGLFLGDGYTVNRKSHEWKQDFFGFSVFKERERRWVRKALAGLGVRYTENQCEGAKLAFYIYDKPLLGYLKKLGKAKDKYIPNEIFEWDKEYLEELYTGMLNSDGCIQGDKGQNVYYTVSERLADDFQRLCLHTGRSCVKTKSKNSKGSFKPDGYGWVLSVVQENKVFWLEKVNHKNPDCRNYDEVKYSGPVHCARIAENHILLSRFNGRTVWSGNSWDSFVPGPKVWQEVFRVLKPGGHVISFSGTRTYDLMTTAMRLASLEVRDKLDYYHAVEQTGYHAFCYGSGFPKSFDIGKAIDKAAGAEREVVGTKLGKPGYSLSENDTEAHGRGTYGKFTDAEKECAITAPATDDEKKWDGYGTALKPAHEPIAQFSKADEDGTMPEPYDGPPFKYQAKAAKKERNFGCKWMKWVMRNGIHTPIDEDEFKRLQKENEDRKDEEGFKAHRLIEGNVHPTVKPLSLCRYLVKMVKMPGDNLILDPFCGSGTVLCAAVLEGCDYVGIDSDPMSVELSEARTHYFRCLGEGGLK